MILSAVKFFFVVATWLLAAGHANGPIDVLQYNKADWPTKAACEAFAQSDEAKASLASLKTAAANAYGAPEDKVLLTTICTQDNEAGQPANIPEPPAVPKG